MSNNNSDEITLKETHEFLNRFENDKDFQRRTIADPVKSFKEIFSQFKHASDDQINEIFKEYKELLKQERNPQVGGSGGFGRMGPMQALAGALAGAVVAWAVGKYSFPGPNPAE